MKEDGKNEFFDIDFEVFDDRIVVKFMKCSMQDWNGGFFEKLKQIQTAAPPEILEALKKTSQFVQFDLGFNNLFSWFEGQNNVTPEGLDEALR